VFTVWQGSAEALIRCKNIASFDCLLSQ